MLVWKAGGKVGRAIVRACKKSKMFVFCSCFFFFCEGCGGGGWEITERKSVAGRF